MLGTKVIVNPVDSVVIDSTVVDSAVIGSVVVVACVDEVV